MCLDKVTKVYNPPEEKEGIGWKVFTSILIEGRKCFANMFANTTNSDLEREYEVWYDANDPYWGPYIDINFYINKRYPAGFHIFTTEEDAIVFLGGYYSPNTSWIISKVKYNKVVAKGTQDRLSCIVARRMMALK